MSSYEKYVNIFCEIFSVQESDLKNLCYKEIEQWDSVGHITLIASLEDCFDIQIEPADILEINSFEKGKNILMTKYGISM